MRKLHKLFLIPLLMLLCVVAHAQTRVVKGKVISATDNSPVSGATILVKGKTTGTATDNDGSFSLSVPDGRVTLVISSVGFESMERLVEPNQTDVTFTISDNQRELEGVVVTALGITRQAKTLVYATEKVKPAELTEVRDANNVLNSLQGKVTNALITQASGGPGSGARIVLRGNRSIQGSNNALIVVDGVPITNGTNGTVTSDFGGLQGSDGASSINPDDIESMTVLRGASAAALYGSQAGNGVIVITTKKGRADKASVTINSGITAERPFIMPDLQNSYGQGNSGAITVNAAGESITGESWGAKLDGHEIKAYNGEMRPYSAQPDNVKDFFRTGITLNNSIGVSGGSEKMQTYLSYTNNKVEGIIPKNDMMRHTFNLRLSNQVSKRFSTDAKITYLIQDIDSKFENGESAQNPLMVLNMIPRNVSLNDAKNFQTINSLGVPVPAVYPVTNLALYQNPYWILNNTFNNESRARIMGFLSAKFDITPWLNITGRGNLDKITDRLEEMDYQGTLGAPTGGGVYRTAGINVTQKWFDVMLNGKNSLTKNLSLDYRVGAILQDNKYDQVNTGANGLNVPNFFSLNFVTNPSHTQGSSQVQTQAVFGQVNVALKESIFLDASLRNEWDSRLPSPHSFSYPSVGISAILSDLIALPAGISFLKVSGNYAEVGNGGQAQIRFNTYTYSQGAGQGYISRNGTRAIEDLKPEVVKNLEVGIDARFMQNRIGLQLTAYRSNSVNQLLQVQTPPAIGFSNQYINAGDIRNKGLELVINASPIVGKEFNWDISFNVAMNRNKIVKLTDDVKEFNLEGFSRSATPIVKEGGSYGDMIGFVWMKDVKGNYMVTADGKPLSSITTGELQHIGNFNPRATLGLTNTFNYKGIHMRLLVDGRIGGTIVDGTEQIIGFNGQTEITTHYREGGWNLGGVASDGTPVSAAINAENFWKTASGGRYGSAEFFSYDATNFRIRELSLGYSIPMKSGFVLKEARLSLVGRNLLFLYRGKNKLDIPGLPSRKMTFDPDMTLGNSNWQGISYGNFPSTRSMGLNLQLTF